MTTASILALLQMALTLLAVVQSTPNLPQPMRDYAVQVAQQAIAQATQAIGQTAAVPVSSSFPGVTLNVTPYTGTVDTFVANIAVGKWTDYTYEIDWGEGDGSVQTKRSRVITVCNNPWNCSAPAGQLHQYGTTGEFPIALYAVKNGVRTLVARASARVSSLTPTAQRVFIEEPGNNASFKIGTLIPVVWHVENAPWNSQVLLHLEGINTTGGVSGGTWQSPQLPVAGQNTQTHFWQTGSGYLTATGSYRLTAYLVACEPQGCNYNYDSQGGLGRTRYATSQPVTLDIVAASTPTTVTSMTNPMVIHSFTASPTTITSGQNTTLSFSSNLTQNDIAQYGGFCNIEGRRHDTNATFSVMGQGSASASITLAPSVTTTYTLFCSSGAKDGSPSATSVTTVTVLSVESTPAITMSAAWGGSTVTSGGITVPSGQAVRLQWNAQNASSCTVTSTRWQPEYVVQNEWSTVSGDVTVTAQSTSVRYTVSCQGSGGSSSAFVQVNPQVEGEGVLPSNTNLAAAAAMYEQLVQALTKLQALLAGN